MRLVAPSVVLLCGACVSSTEHHFIGICPWHVSYQPFSACSSARKDAEDEEAEEDSMKKMEKQARTLLGAPGLATRSDRMLLVTKGLKVRKE